CRAGILLCCPHLTPRLPIAQASIKDWGRAVPRQRPPIPGCLVYCIIRLFVKRQHFELALIVWLAFDVYLCISEIFTRTSSDFTLNGETLGLFIGRAKTGLN